MLYVSSTTPTILKTNVAALITNDMGGFHVVAKIIRELKSHMIPYKFKWSHWWKIALQSECCNFNQ